AMRVRRYFAFVDLCGFTRFTEVHGDEEAVAVLTGFRTLVRYIASEHGVRVAKWLGDGAMFVSTDGPALAAALLALDERASDAVDLPIRAGFSGGDVILFEGDDYIGGPVNLASRLSDVAAPGEILAGADMAEFVSDCADLRPVEPRLVPGFMQPVPIVALAVAEPITGTHEIVAS
ncbi:MAG TPA: adenylate/guanylate cyclase domain-containing protein, partial [Acidimicrobiia bacterium]|nr:adenylate/guanylate cyclase domain-containing protein [Acidimicrobiia bacterium]